MKFYIFLFRPPCFFDAQGSKNEIVKLKFGRSECRNSKYGQNLTTLIQSEVAFFFTLHLNQILVPFGESLLG